MSFRSFFIVVLLAIFSFGFGWLLHILSIALFPALLFAGFILFFFQQFSVKELTGLTWTELWSEFRPIDFWFVSLGLFVTFLILPKMLSSTMPLGLVLFMAFTVFALIFLSSYWIFYEERTGDS